MIVQLNPSLPLTVEGRDGGLASAMIDYGGRTQPAVGHRARRQWRDLVRAQPQGARPEKLEHGSHRDRLEP